MKKRIVSPFHQLVVDRFGFYEARHLHQQMGLPSHPITRAYNTPEKTPHKVLIGILPNTGYARARIDQRLSGGSCACF